MYQGQRPRLPIPFGYGLDRLSGVSVVDQKSTVDLRNVTLARGRLGIRDGINGGLDFGFGTDCIGLCSVRQLGLEAAVVYDAATRVVKLYFTDGVSVSLVGTLWTLDASILLHVPRVTMADCYGYVFIAHDEPNITYRGATKYLQVSDLTLHTLQANLDGMGANDVQFRGVIEHLAYLVGWGYGTNTTPDRGETVRISHEGDPLTFEGNHYVLAGQIGDPVIGAEPCVSNARPSLALMKRSSSWRLDGSGRADFAIFPMDPAFGLISCNAKTSVNGAVYAWTLEGPRVSTGGPFTDLSAPLDVGNPYPSYPADPNIATPGIDACCWFDRHEQEIVWVFSPTAYGWGYVLHLRDDPPRWSFRTYKAPIRCADTIYQGEGGGTLSLITATIDTLTPIAPSYGAGDDNPQFTVAWHLSGAGDGSENVQVWTKSTYDGNYYLRTTVNAHNVNSTHGTATITVPHYLTNTTVAIRVVKGSVPGSGYTGGPDTWPGTARSSAISAGAITTFVLPAQGWGRSSGTQQGLLFAFVGPGASGASHPELTWHYDQSSDGGATWANHDGGDHAAPLFASKHGNTDSLHTFRYRLKITGPDANTGFTNTVDRIMAPDPPTIVSTVTASTPPGLADITVSATPGVNGGGIAITLRNLTTGNPPVGPNVIDGVTQPSTTLEIAASVGDQYRADAYTDIQNPGYADDVSLTVSHAAFVT